MAHRMNTGHEVKRFDMFFLMLRYCSLENNLEQVVRLRRTGTWRESSAGKSVKQGARHRT
jgi:hypothetical protein